MRSFSSKNIMTSTQIAIARLRLGQTPRVKCRIRLSGMSAIPKRKKQ